MKAGILTVPLHHGREIMKDLKSQKGEVVTAVMVVMMVGMMILGGMFMMHDGQGNHQEHTKTGHQDHSDADHRQMHDGHGDDTQSVPENGK